MEFDKPKDKDKEKGVNARLDALEARIVALEGGSPMPASDASKVTESSDETTDKPEV